MAEGEERKVVCVRLRAGREGKSQIPKFQIPKKSQITNPKLQRARLRRVRRAGSPCHMNGNRKKQGSAPKSRPKTVSPKLLRALWAREGMEVADAGKLFVLAFAQAAMQFFNHTTLAIASLVRRSGQPGRFFLGGAGLSGRSVIGRKICFFNPEEAQKAQRGGFFCR